MANFVALTPPLGQQPWGPIQFFSFTAFAAIPANISFEELGYPPLNAPIRVLILKKYPGTIFPDPDLEDVFPCADPDPVHIEELWQKYNDALEDPHIYDDIPTTKLATFIEREVAEWVAEIDASPESHIFVIADRTIMDIINSNSKKRARRDAFADDAALEKKESRSAKQVKSSSSSTAVTKKNPSMKEQYDNAFPANVVVDQESPAYLMALNYLKSYAKSNEKYADRVSEIIEHQGMDLITQRCAKFFAWGLKQAIRSLKVESAGETIKPAVETAKATVDIDSEEEEEDNSDYDEIDLEADSDDESVVNFQPLNRKPTFKFEKSALNERLGSFMEEMKVANEDLVDRSMEVSDSETSHIEMNLGLGVLEEQNSEESADEKALIEEV